MDCLTLSHKAHSECSWRDAKRGSILVGLAHPGNCPYQNPFSPFLSEWVIQALNSTESYSSVSCSSPLCSNTLFKVQSELKKKKKTTSQVIEGNSFSHLLNTFLGTCVWHCSRLQENNSEQEMRFPLLLRLPY